jgi:RHS repeat-associated protein
VRYFQYDARGHCILQTEASGDLIEQYNYAAFGQPWFMDRWGNDIGHSPWGNRFLFTGREWLSDLRIYDYRNRLYQPELGRFLQPDPKQFEAGDYNLYRYCHNDPVNKTDPFGLKEQVYLYSEPADVPGGQLAYRWFGLTHQWLVIKDDGRTVWAGGLGTARGVPGTHNQTAKDLPGVKTYVVDHRGRENSPNARGMPVDADPDSVRAVMPIGARAGRYIPGVNDCNILVRNAQEMSTPLQPRQPSGPQQSCVSGQPAPPTPPEPPRIWDNKPISTKGWWQSF